MGGVFGVVSKYDCVFNLFYGTDYNSHLGTSYAGLAVQDSGEPAVIVKEIQYNFQATLGEYVKVMRGNKGIGVVSDLDEQPSFPKFFNGNGLVNVSRINNLEELVRKAEQSHPKPEWSGKIATPTDIIAYLISKESNIKDGIESMQEAIRGSCSLLILTKKGIYAARDKLGRTPLFIGEQDGSYALSSDPCAFPNTGFELKYTLRPGEIVFVTEDGFEQLKKPGNRMQVCGFNWPYFGDPTAIYEGLDEEVEIIRNRLGEFLAEEDNVEADLVIGIPDSGIAASIGYSNRSGIPFGRSVIKYLTWARSFMRQDQSQREFIAKMKLIPVKGLINRLRLIVVDDSLVRGTTQQGFNQIFYLWGAKEVHTRLSCPPLQHPCEYLNFSRSKTAEELAARRAIKKLEGSIDKNLEEYTREGSDKYLAMIEEMRKELGSTTLGFQSLKNFIKAIGLPKEKLCTHCWDGSSYF